MAVLSKLKNGVSLRANIETLAGLTLTIEDELKQKDFGADWRVVFGTRRVPHEDRCLDQATK